MEAKILLGVTLSPKKRHHRKPDTVYCNFFSSPELFYILRENYGIFALGTIVFEELMKLFPEKGNQEDGEKGVIRIDMR
ncbi:unnamed protein product [Pieris brassicae]|uniref:Uncharacterized protein n=1 Tax=Pieris brassicae TaxID=7116 RepID=A0A9P0XGY4_PIEBR|nr:unnamed protein product [Pieris brassicae]